VITPYCYFHEPKLCFFMLIILLVFRNDRTPLHGSAANGRLEVCRLLVASKADVAARNRCRSPLRARHGLLTPVAEAAKLHSETPSTLKRPTLLHICSVSARRHDALAAPHPPGDHLARSKPLPSFLPSPALFAAATCLRMRWARDA
jgi:hypothetical protein